MQTWAISIVGASPNGKGGVDIKNRLYILSAVCKETAIGKAVLSFQEELTDFPINIVVETEVQK